MPTSSSVTLNPGSSGANVATDQQSTGVQMPLSELAASSDGIQDSLPVTGLRPLPVADAAAESALADMRANLQALVDQLVLGVSQVAAKLIAAPAGIPDANNVVSVQGAPGGAAVPVVGKVQGQEVVGNQPSFSPLLAGYLDSSANVRYPTTNVVAGGGFGGPTTYANVVTDLEGYRDDFNGTSLVQNLSGTCTFTNGSTLVTGLGTAFTSQLSTADTYVKLSTDPDSAYTKLLVQPFYANSTGGSNTTLTLVAPYPGSGGTGTGLFTFWAPTVGAGGSIVEGTAPAASSQLGLLTGTTSGSITTLQHGTHFVSPCNLTAYAWASNAILNNELSIGLVDSVAAPGTQTRLVLTGTDATQVTLRTSAAGGLVESNAGTLPNGLTWLMPGAVRYRIVASEDAVVLFANDIPIVRNKLHLPAFYNPQPLTIAVQNTGAVSSSSSLFVDVVGITSHDKVEVEMSTTPQPAPAQVTGYDALGNLQQPLITAPSTPASVLSPALVVAVSPATPVTANGLTPAGAQQGLPLAGYGQALSVQSVELSAKLDTIIAQLDTIKWTFMNAFGNPSGRTDPSFTLTQQ